MSAPDRIYLDGDAEAGDGYFTRCFETAKPCSEPAIEYVRADLCDPRQDERVKALEAEVARLREAGQAVVNEFPVSAGTAKGIPPDECGYGSIYRLRLALEQGEGGPQGCAALNKGKGASDV